MTAFAQVCPGGDSDEGPFEADTWDEIPRTISFSSDAAQTAVANPLDPLGPAYDPIAGGDPIADESASSPARTLRLTTPAPLCTVASPATDSA